MKALVLAKDFESAGKLCAGARKLASEVVAVLIGDTQNLTGIADKTIHIALPEGAVYDDAADTVIAIFEKETPDFVYVEATRRLKVVGGKLAASQGASIITDVIEFQGDAGVNRYFGGIAQRTLKPSTVGFYTMSAELFAEESVSGTDVVEEAVWAAPAHSLELVEVRPIEKSGVDLFKADIVVSVGRGFAEKEELNLANDLCGKLGAGLACSRPLTEGLNWLPSDIYIGVSGLMIAPKAYIAVGISGQMQHMVGCNRSGTLFAINKDKNAPVFKQCDVGLVGDIKDVLPALTAAL